MDGKRIDEKLDKILEKISSMEIETAKQSVMLDEVVRRTHAHEERLQVVEKHSERVNAAVKLLGGGGLLTVLVELILKIKGSK